MKLLRVPGFGVNSVDKMLKVRRYRVLRLEDFLRLRVAWKRAKPFVITADYRPATQLQNSDRLAAYFRPAPEQLAFAV